ncbi:thrombospondin [Micromonospora sp. KLBMP9576]|uniref:thrombospondin n=1 Tax=Micromonospora sp. KLBMP9576 TaxID=3424769 RepID=UPI003D8B764F
MKIPSLLRRSEEAQNRDENVDGHAVAAGTGQAGPAQAGVDRSGGPDQPVVTERDSEQTTYRSSAASSTEGRDAAAEKRAAERAAVARAATARPTDDGSRRTSRATGTDPTLEQPTGARTTDADRDAAAGVARTDRDHAVAAAPAVHPRPGTDADRPVTDARAVDAERTATADRTLDAERTVDRDGDGVPDRRDPSVAVGPKPRASMLATLGLVVGVAGALFVLTGTLAGYGIGLGAVGAVLAVLGLMATRRRHIAGKTDALLGIVLGLGAVVLGVLAMTGQFDWPSTDGDWVQRFREWLDSQFVDRF